MDGNDADLPLAGVMLSPSNRRSQHLSLADIWRTGERASSRSSDQATETSAETTIA